MSEKALQAYIRFFETLRRENLVGLADLLAPKARFKDPFNDVRGVGAIRAVFEDMFKRTIDPHFVVTDRVLGDACAYIRWGMYFRLRTDEPLRCIEGVSRIVFDAQGRVTEHVDYWDAAGQLYEKLPLIGAAMRWLGRRIAARV